VAIAAKLVISVTEHVRAHSFPAKHGEKMIELADALSELKGLVMHPGNWSRMNPLPHQTAHAKRYEEARTRVNKLVEEISYDTETRNSAVDFAQLCSMVVGDLLSRRDHREHLAELDRISGPIFHRLHQGKGIRRSKIPWPQWILDSDKQAIGGVEGKDPTPAAAPPPPPSPQLLNAPSASGTNEVIEAAREELVQTAAKLQLPYQPILKSPPKVPEPTEKRPPLNPAHEARCKNALIEVGNFLKGDLTRLHEDLANAGNPENPSLKSTINKLNGRAMHAHLAAKKLESQWTWLTMMGDFDLKPLIAALGDLQRKVSTVKSGVDEGLHAPALMLSVKHMLKQNLEVGKIGDGLIKAVDKMDAEFFPGVDGRAASTAF
jgi:hypothetical protein